MIKRNLNILILITLSSYKFVLGSFQNETVKFTMNSWNLPDTTAEIGRIFEYQLPKNQFGYKIGEIDSNILPSWLSFNVTSFKLTGLLTDPSFVGKSTYIQVIPLLANRNADEAATEILKINLEKYNPFSKNPSDNDDFIKCKPISPLTTTTVILDANLSQLKLVQILELIRKFALFFDLSESAIRLTLLGDTPIYDSLALVAGPGDVQVMEKVNGRGAVVQWEVGCGVVQSKHLTTLQNVETFASNGFFKKSVGYGVIGWYVTNKKAIEGKRSKHRLKRYFVPTPTPTILFEPFILSSTSTKKITTISIKATKPKPSKKTKPTGKPNKTQIYTTAIIKQPPLKTEIGHVQSTREYLNPPKVFVGEVFEYKIPNDLFIDSITGLSDGITTKLTLTDGIDAPSTLWFQLIDGSLIRGVPLQQHEGVQEYLLKGMNKKDKEATCPLKMEVGQMSKTGRVAEMGVIFDMDYKSFLNNASLRILVAEKIASAFNDADSSQILITHVKQGSVDYSWTNRSVVASASGECPKQQLTKLFNMYIHEDGTMNNNFLEATKPLFIEGGSATAYGVCAQHIRSRKALRIGGKAVVATTTMATGTITNVVSLEDEAKSGETKTMNWTLVRIIIPALIIIGIVILALISACFLYRRRKAKKMEMERGVVKKGAPVIFAHELEETPAVMATLR